MFTRSLAILLAVLGLYLCAVQASAQSRGRGWGYANPGYGYPRAAGMRGFGGYGGQYGRRFSAPPGYGRGYPGPYPAGPPAYAPSPAFAPPPRAPFAEAPFAGDWRAQQNAVRQAVREGRNIPLSRAIQAVRQRTPGRELDAGLETGPNGRPVYRVRWAGQDGRRQDYMVDAGNGALLGVQGGP